MTKFSFSLQDAPDFWTTFECDCEFGNIGGNPAVENAIACLIKDRNPKLYECHRRIKKLIVEDENGNVYQTDDFDIPGSLIKIESYN